MRDGRLFIGATAGLAALDDKGAVIWTIELPEADGRAVAVDGEHLAYTSFLISGVERGSGLTGALMWGASSQKLIVESSDVGLVATNDGKPIWKAKTTEPTALSPPALGPAVVAVQASKSVLLYDRATGAPIKEVSTFTDWLGISGAYDSRMTVMRPLWVSDGVFAAHQSWLKKVSTTGDELVATKSLDRNFFFLMSGPILCKDKIILSEAAYPEGNVLSGKKAKLYAASAKGEPVWVAETDDDVSGTADLACNQEDDLCGGQRQGQRLRVRR